MKLVVRRMEPGDLPAIERFNRRLEEANEPHRVYPEAADTKGENHPVTGRLFVALDEGELRGAVWLHEQDAWVGGQQLRVGFLRLPLSESVVNPAYRGVPASLIMQVLRAQPRLMALGLGAHETPFARLLGGFKWPGLTVPFQFSLVNVRRVLRRLEYARRDPTRRLAMDAAAFLGVGSLGTLALGAQRALKLAGHGALSAERVPQYGPWADELWARARERYDLVPARDAATLNTLYGPDFWHDYHRLRITRGGRDVGHAAVLRADMRDQPRDPYFGRLAVALVADLFGDPADAPGIAAAAVRYATSLDVDLVMSFQLHPAWRAALDGLGFLGGPSNFCWYRAPGIDKLVPAMGTPPTGVHLNRADAEGPKWF
jgi:hypothetical protein